MLEQELDTYYKNLNRLRKENPSGGFVIIKEDYIFPAVWPNRFDAKSNGDRLLGENSYLIGEINREESQSGIFEESCSALNSRKDEIPSLIKGGFTNEADNTSLSNEIELRKYCLDKAIEVYKENGKYPFAPNEGLIEYAEMLYTYITTGKITDFRLPGMQDKTNRTESTPIPEPVPIPVKPIRG